LRAAASSGAAALAARFSLGCSDDDDLPAPEGPRPMEMLTFQLSLNDFTTLPNDLVLELGDRRYALNRHDATTRADQRSENTLLTAIPDGELTHFVENVAVPADAPMSYRVTYAASGDTTLRGVALAGIHVPRAGVLAAQSLKGASFGYRSYRIRGLGLTLGARSSGGGLQPLACGGGSGDITDLDHFVDEYDCARYLAFHHSDVISLDKSAAAIVMHHIDCSTGLEEVARVIKEAGLKPLPPDAPEFASAWMRGQYDRDLDGNRVQQTDAEGNKLTDDRGNPLYEWSYKTDDEVLAALDVLVQGAVSALHDDKDLENVRFQIPTARLTNAEPLPNADVAPLQAAAPSAYVFAPVSEGFTAGQCVTSVHVTNDRVASFEVLNSYNRHVGVYCAFLDAGDNPLKLADLKADAGDGLPAVNIDNDYCAYKGLLAPPSHILGIPLPAPEDVARDTFKVRIPEGASKLAVLTTALAGNRGDLRDEFAKTTVPATIGTMVFEIGIPVISLTYGALWTAGTWKPFVRALATPALKLLLKTASAIAKLERGGDADFRGLGISLGNETLKLILASVGTEFFKYWVGAVASGATRFVPVLGNIIVGLQVLETGILLGRAAGGIALGQKVTQTIISSTNRVEVRMDPETLGFPATGNKWIVTLKPHGGTPSSQSGPLKADGTPVIFAEFPAVTSGGTYDVTVRIVAASADPKGKDYPVGGYDGTFVNVVPDGKDFVFVPVQIMNYPIPILATTVYSPNQKVDVDATGAHVLVPAAVGEQPPGAVPDACLGGSSRVCAPIAIGLDADSGQLGYGWQATDATLKECDSESGAGSSLFALQNINLAVAKGGPDANVKQYACGRVTPVYPLYMLHGKAAGGSYVFEAASGAAYQLRKLGLGPDDSSFRAGTVVAKGRGRTVRGAAWNNFKVMVVSGDADVLEIIDLTPKPVHGKDVPPTSTVRGGPGKLRGHISGAVAVTSLYDGDGFLVLENGNKRIQAFGLTGEPLAYFGPDTPPGGKSQKVEILDLPGDEDLLDISIDENSRKIYVLSRKGFEGTADSFFLRIYDPKTASLLATTQRFAAAKIVLDTNQNVYALGWDAKLFRGRLEPGVWRWSPSLPPPGTVVGGG
jgi:hypothetical protein